MCAPVKKYAGPKRPSDVCYQDLRTANPIGLLLFVEACQSLCASSRREADESTCNITSKRISVASPTPLQRHIHTSEPIYLQAPIPLHLPPTTIQPRPPPPPQHTYTCTSTPPPSPPIIAQSDVRDKSGHQWGTTTFLPTRPYISSCRTLLVGPSFATRSCA